MPQPRRRSRDDADIPVWRRVWLTNGGERQTGRVCDSFGVAWCDDTGQVRRRSFPTRELAEKFRGWMEAKLNPWLLGEPMPQWANLTRSWLATLADRTKAHQDRAGDTLQVFGEMSQAVADSRGFTPQAVEDFVTRRRRLVSRASLATELRYLSAFARYLVRMGHLQWNPVVGVRLAPAPRLLKSMPDDADFVRLLATIPHAGIPHPRAMHAFILLAGVTGVRQDACRRACWEQFELVLGVPEVLLWRVIDKGQRETLRGIPPAAAVQLLDYRGERTGGRLFPWDSFPRKPWNALKPLAGWGEWCFHRLRAVAGGRLAVRAIRAGAAGLDHSSPRVFADSYQNVRQIQLEVAKATVLPELPPLPLA